MDADTKRILNIVTHLSQFFAAVLMPLIVYLAVHDKDVKEHAKEVLNWHISQCIYWIISAILVVILIGFVGMFILGIIGIIFPIIGAVKAGSDEVYRYPLTIRFLK